MKYIYNWTDKLGRKRYRFRRKGFPGVEPVALAMMGHPKSLTATW